MQGRYRDGVPEEDRRRIAGCIFGVAILAAPFIGLLYSQMISLIVLALALVTVLAFAFLQARDERGPRRTQLVMLALVNLVFLVLTIAVMVALRR